MLTEDGVAESLWMEREKGSLSTVFPSDHNIFDCATKMPLHTIHYKWVKSLPIGRQSCCIQKVFNTLHIASFTCRFIPNDKGYFLEIPVRIINHGIFIMPYHYIIYWHEKILWENRLSHFLHQIYDCVFLMCQRYLYVSGSRGSAW